MERFMTAHSFSASLLMPEPLSLTQMSPLREVAGPRVTKEMVIVRYCPGRVTSRVALRELSISSAKAYAKG